MSRSELRVCASACGGSPSTRWMVSMTFGPPGWQIHAAMSRMDRPCSARKLETPCSIYFSAIGATSVESTMRKPSVPMSQPITPSVSG